jgi:hypothetical protein
VGPSTTTPFTAKAPPCLNFSASLYQTISLSINTFHMNPHPTHCSRVSKGSLICDYSMFSSPQHSSVLNSRPPPSPFKMLHCYSSPKYREWKKFFPSPVLDCHAEEVIVSPNPHTGFMVLEKWGIAHT